MNENNNCPLQSIRNFFDSEICKKVNYLQMFRLNKILKMVMHHGAYSQGISIKKECACSLALTSTGPVGLIYCLQTVQYEQTFSTQIRLPQKEMGH